MNANTKYIAIRVDMECPAEGWWDSLREAAPRLADSLTRNEGAVIAAPLWGELVALPGWEEESEPEQGLQPLIDCGSEGDQWSDVVGSRHEVFDELR